MRSSLALFRRGVLVVLTVVLATGGCGVRVVSDDTSPPASTTITVRIINNTNYPLDPQIYIGTVDAGAAGLFVAANKYTDFGVGGLGTMLGRTEASFTVNCGELGLIGTQGGIFGEDLQEPLGSGRQVILQENVNVNCGDEVTFAFSAEGDSLITSYGVTLQGE